MNYRTAWASIGVIGALTLAGCASAAPTAEEEGNAGVLGADAIDSAEEGTITWCAQKDSSGTFTAIVDQFNDDPANDGFKVELLEFPDGTDEWRNQFVQRAQAKSPECDVFGSDVVWTAEFADRGFLYDLTPYVESRASEFIPSTLSTTEYKGSNWAVPFGTNVAFMYYRTDQLDAAPATWQEVFEAGADNSGYVYQAAAYEGLTVTFLELATAAGGNVLSEDGSESIIDSPENLKALNFMIDGIKSGATPESVLTFHEEEARRTWEAGEATLMRNWTYAYTLGQQAPAIAENFEISPLPAFEGGKASGVLGGVNLVVSRFSENPGGALKVVDYATALDQQVLAAQTAQAPTLTAAYDDPSVQEALPFYETLEAGIEQAVSRPVSPVYAQVSQAIYENVSAALSGSVTPEEALKNADQDINDALATF